MCGFGFQKVVTLKEKLIFEGSLTAKLYISASASDTDALTQIIISTMEEVSGRLNNVATNFLLQKCLQISEFLLI